MIPFISKAEFDKWRAEGGKSDVLFPIMDYDICKRIWETSPLIKVMIEAVEALPTPKAE
jgi:hypothetical protein